MNHFEYLFNRFAHMPTYSNNHQFMSGYTTDNGVVYECVLAGVPEEQVSLEFADNVGTLKYVVSKGDERKFTFVVDKKYDTTKATAKLSLGMLKIEIPKLESKQSTRVKIETSKVV